MSEDRWPPYQLSGDAPVVQAVNALIRKSEILTERALQSERSPRTLSEAVKQIYAVADASAAALTASVNRLAESNPSARIQCAKGCSHCCYRVPEVSFAELAHIWSIVQALPEDSKLELRDRTRTYLEKTAPFRPNLLGQARAACPFLKGSECSIYETRPLSCRSLNSRSASVCEAIRMGQPAAQRPAWQELIQDAMALRMGTRLGQFFEGMSFETLDLGHALAVLFENEDAVQQYLNGKDLFLSSHSAHESEPFDSGQIARSNGPAFCSERESSAPSGNLSKQDFNYLREASGRYLESGNFREYVQALSGNSVNLAMARINVPRVAASEDEIDDSRAAFMSSMKEFEERAFPPDLAFNSLAFHQTMNLPYEGRQDVELLREHGRFVVEAISQRALPQFSAIEGRQRKSGKLRVGYISGHLSGSSNGRWAWPWVKHHSDEIESFCFLVGPTADAYTTLFRTYANHFFWLKRSVPENAEFIRECDLDVLIFTDIGFYARITQYSSLRLAPIQCTAWGGPETSGLPTIDYYLSSEYMEPEEADSHYTEKLVRLPRSGMLFYRPNFDTPPMDRAYFGLPEAGPLLLMGQACVKLTPRHDELFARIAERANTELVFLKSDPPGDSAVVKRRLAKAGVRARWLRRLSGPEFVGLLKIADASLDPLMWSGGNTTVEALSVGTPVVTFPGPFMRGRHSLAFLRQANAPGLVARNEEDFIDLASNLERQREAASQLQPNALYGDVGVIQALDEFLFSVANI